MTTISFTCYIDATAEEVESRLAAAAVTAPDGAVVDVADFVDRSRVVVRFPWDAESETAKAQSTLAATRFARTLDRVVTAA